MDRVKNNGAASGRAVRSGLRRVHHHVKKAARPIHARTTKKVHLSLLQHISLYRRWWSWQYHRHVHIAGGIMGSIIVIAMVITHVQGAFALSTWTQTDWSGGVGGSLTNQYSAETDFDTTSANQVTLARSSAPSWFNTAWQYREPLTLNNSSSNLGVASETLTDFPVHVKLTSSNFDFTKAQSQGQDIRFTDNDGTTALNYEIEDWSATNQQADVWVNVPSVTADSSTYNIYMYYGNASASDAQNKNSVWNSGYAGVWHLDESSGNNSDSTSNNRTGTVAGSPSRISGQFNTAMNYASGSDDDAISAVNLSGLSYAIEGWFKYPLVSTSSGWRTLTRGTSDHQLLVNSSNQLGSYDNSTGRNFVSSGYTISGLSTGWHYIAVVGNNSSASSTFYIDGASVGSTSWKSNNNIQYFGNYQSGGQQWGALDEFRISTTLRDSAWIAASYKTEANQLVTYGSPSGPYKTSGTLTSNIFDTGTAENWGDLAYAATVPAGDTVTVRVRAGNQPDLSDAPDFTSCTAISSGAAITSSCAPNKSRYAQYQLQFTSDSIATPTFTSITVPYTASDITPPPTNASNAAMYRSKGGASVAADGWTNADPYFTWAAGADDSGGSGILGYCLYLGQDPTANPVTTKGDLGTGPVNTHGACQFAVSGTNVETALSGYIGTALTASSSPYYLTIKAIDNADNVFGGSPEQFEFRYDNTPPANPSFITAPSEFVSNAQVTLTWPTTGSDAASDTNSGVAGLQYRIGSSGTWYGTDHSGNQDMTDLLSNDGNYTTVALPDFADLVQGNNIVYFRTWDGAGNVSQAYVTTVIKLNSTAPSSPQNFTASPSTNSTNAFAFSWLAPATFTGSAGNITYCYTVNVLPSNTNCTYTDAGQKSLSAGAFATEPGENTMYVVAKDEAGNINYATAAAVTFTANTPAPGIPLNPDIADISIKSTNSWKLALSWNEPSTVGAGIATYKIFRSTDGSSFTNVARTGGTSYVDANLNQQTYYYKIQACDSANNCGGFTNIFSLYPTGKFTSPATLISGPNVSVTTRTATVTWTTERNSDSSVEYGLSSGHYFTTDAANSSQVTSHEVGLNSLSAGTTYYYRSLWTDQDGNIGTSAEGSFTTMPAPTVSNVSSGNINLTSATIQFTANNATAVQLVYGSSALSSTQTLNTSTSTSTYTIPLHGLNAGTTYTFKLNPYDTSGNVYENPTSFAFTTPPRPVIANVDFQPVAGALTGTEQISWTTNVPATSMINYGLLGSDRQNQIDTTMTTKHAMTIGDLSYNTQYSVTATSVDGLGNAADSDLQVFKSGIDTRPPTVSGVTIQPSIVGTGADAKGQLVVSWKTDKPGTSQVAYGEGTSGDYSTKTAESTALVNNHVVVVSGLSTSEVYHLSVISDDADGVRGVSGDHTTIIGQATDNALSIVFNALQGIFGL